MASHFHRSQRHASDPGGQSSDRRLSDTSISSTSASTTGVPYVSRALSSFSFSRSRSVDIDEDDSRGAYGLNLLYSPPEPLVDLIFVHGLGGGSVKTWCKGGDRRLFWPQVWLQRETDLQNVRVHSFGYNADWKDSKETYLNIHDFGRSLFSDMSTSPHLRHDRNTRIVLVGHSMGGLVIKKAFLLAHQDPQAQELAARMQAMFFLATPHRGSDSAKLLNNLLRASVVLSSRSYINDLSRNSTSLQVISDEFRMFADRLQLWSFYETMKSKISSSASVLIVDRDSAVLGYKEERVQLLNADHFNVSKFRSPSDPNYHIIKNSLAKAVETILGDVVAQKTEETKHMIESLEFYLGIESLSEDDLSNLKDLRADGSCNWIFEQPTFETWRDASEGTPQVYWLTGQPGSGKSVTSAHVVTHLDELGLEVYYFFFKHGHKDQQTTSGLLRQLAYQMACRNPTVRQRLFAMQEAGVILDKDDDRTLWRKLFVNEILKIHSLNHQYWVMDGLDECHDFAKLFVMLSKMEPPYSVNLFFSSRRIPGLERHFTPFKNRLFSHDIEPDDTREDIRSYIENHCDSLVFNVDYREELVDRLIKKSDGSFLWTKLAFEELEQVYSEDTMSEVLDEIPEGMVDLYHRLLDTMSRNSREVKLTRAILAWAVCGVRNLNIRELQAAIRLELKSNIPDIGRAVEGLCAQMVRVEKNETVQLVHSTARDFLMDSSLDSPFSIKRSETHENLTKVCLQYLCSDELQPPKNRALISGLKGVHSHFADYAATRWSDHLVSASSKSDDLLEIINRFLETNVLSWIEFVARRKKNLYTVSRTAKNLRNYLDRRAKHLSPLGRQFASVSQWATDLLRVVAKFGRNLLKYPSAIYFIVPPLCPSNSSIHQEFGSGRGLLSVEGFSNASWGDCISYIEQRDTRAMSLAGGDNAFAIGLKSGFAKIYNDLTCQERASLSHGEPIRVLKYSHSSQYIVTSGNSCFKMWTTDGALLWTFSHTDPVVSLTFSQDDNLVVTCTKASAIVSYRVLDGMEVPIDPLSLANPTQARQFARQAILSSSISPDLKVLAVAYRGHPPQMWSLENDVKMGACKKDALSVAQLLFNPNPSVEVLAVTYQDGELALFRTWDQEEIASVSGDAYTMAATPDGRTIATGDMLGTIKLWDFETLHLLYCIKSPDYEVRSLAFSGDGLRLFDIRDSKSKVWEPSALVRKTMSDDSSISESASGNEGATTVGDYGETVAITVMLVPPMGDCIFLGKDDGTVHNFDLANGTLTQLYSHRFGVLPTFMSWNPETMLVATADASLSVLVWRLQKEQSAGGTWRAKTKVLQFSWHTPIRELSMSPDGSYLLLHDESNLNLHLLSESQPDAHPLHFLDQFSISRSTWVKNSRDHNLLLAITDTGHLLVSAVRSPSTHLAIQLLDSSDEPISQTVKKVELNSTEEFLLIEFEDEGPPNGEAARILVYDVRGLTAGGTETQDWARRIGPRLVLRSSDVRSIIGLHGTKVVFLDRFLWVRSYDLTRNTAGESSQCSVVGGDEAARHFFIPFEFIGGNNGVDAVVIESGDVVFPKEGELAIVKNALTWNL